MKILFGIIFLHMLVILRCKTSSSNKVPYISTLIISGLLVAYVVVMLFMMEPPQR